MAASGPPAAASVASVVLVRLLNGRFELPAADELPRPYFKDPRAS
jgi:hypothetical protein